MGIELDMYAMTPEEAHRFSEDPYMDFDRDSLMGCSLSKSHEDFMEVLGDIARESGFENLAGLVYGGEKIFVGDSAILFFEPQAAKTISEELEKVDKDKFKKIWQGYGFGDDEFALKTFDRMRVFFTSAASEGKGVIKFIG